jgi:hypothetical protein
MKLSPRKYKNPIYRTFQYAIYDKGEYTGTIEFELNEELTKIEKAIALGTIPKQNLMLDIRETGKTRVDLDKLEEKGE